MEGRKRVGHTNTRLRNFFFGMRHKRRVEPYNATHHVHERAEYNQNPHHAEHVKQHVGQGRTSRLRTCRKSGEVRCHRGTDVFTHHKRNALVNRKHSTAAEQKRNRHDSRRRLHAHGKDATQQQEEERAEDSPTASRRKEVDDRLVVSQIHSHRIFTQRGKAEEHERETEHEFADALGRVLLGVRKNDAEGEEGPHHRAHVELEPEYGHNPGRGSGTDVRTHDNRNGLTQCEQASVNEAYGKDGRSGRRLHRGSHKGTCEKASDAVLGHGSKDSTQVTAREFLQAFAHGLHAEHEERKATDHFKNHKCHRTFLRNATTGSSSLPFS